MSGPRAYDQVKLGPLLYAGFASTPPAFATNNRARGVRRAGQIYEYKAQELFEQRYDFYLRSPWLVFQTRASNYFQWCQPDGLLFLPEKRIIIICEVKLRHMPEAYWQVTNLYRPVLAHIFSGRSWQFRQLEVVRWYDPATFFPVDPVLVQDPLLTPKQGMGVHICNP